MATSRGQLRPGTIAAIQSRITDMRGQRIEVREAMKSDAPLEAERDPVRFKNWTKRLLEIDDSAWASAVWGGAWDAR